MIYAYCVRRAGEPPPPEGLLGLEEAVVRLMDVEEAGLGFWFSEGRSLNATPGRLRDHDRVVREALRTATPLPIRYGAGCFPSQEAAREALTAQADALRSGLERVAGRVEMGVRVDWDPPEPDAHRGGAGTAAAAPGRAGSGRAYLEARRGEMERRDAVRAAAESALARVEAELSMGGVPTARSIVADPCTAGIVAHLVQKAEVQRYRKCVDAAGDALPDYRLSVSGPWAPYSFA